MHKIRIGHGYDVHRLVENRKLILGGVEIPFERGLLGHSDADVLLHAISDALLGAVALGDIGKHFPDTDPRYAGADSMLLLKEVVRLVRNKGYQVGNLDATILCQRPKLADSFLQCGKTLLPAVRFPFRMSASRLQQRKSWALLARERALPFMQWHCWNTSTKSSDKTQNRRRKSSILRRFFDSIQIEK